MLAFQFLKDPGIFNFPRYTGEREPFKLCSFGCRHGKTKCAHAKHLADLVFKCLSHLHMRFCTSTIHAVTKIGLHVDVGSGPSVDHTVDKK